MHLVAASTHDVAPRRIEPARANIDASPGVENTWGGAGWVEVDYGASGNVSSFTVHGACVDAIEPASCTDLPSGSLATRIANFRANCRCATEQHTSLRWDELNRLVEGRRYDRVGGPVGSGTGAWQYRARMRYRYDGSNQRTVKETFEATSPNASGRVALTVYPGDFERRGLVRNGANGTYDAVTTGSDATETQYLVLGTRVVWDASTPITGWDRDHRLTYAFTDLLQTSAGVMDLRSLAILELSTYTPNGARENLYVAPSPAPLEPMGFTGKESDEELGMTYFGERWLIPRLGRWASPDPLHVHASGGGEALNSYHYVSGNLLQARDPLGLNTLFLGGAGQDAETDAYSTAIVWAFIRQRVVRPLQHRVSDPIAGALVGLAHVTNIARVLAYRSSSAPEYRRPLFGGSQIVQDPIMNSIVKSTMRASNAEGGQRNLAGYSYGSVTGAHAALELSRSGIRVDNLVLVGSPISIGSELQSTLDSDERIGNVLRVDIEGDPVAGDVSPTFASAHFLFTQNERGQQDALARVVFNLTSGRNLWEGVDCSRGGCGFRLTLNGQQVPRATQDTAAAELEGSSSPTPAAGPRAFGSAPVGSDGPREER